MEKNAPGKLKIYTKTGDKGRTSLFGGTRVSKASLRVDTYGTVDELNSLIGLVLSVKHISDYRITTELAAIQNDLLLIGSTLANQNAQSVLTLLDRVSQFEKLIDTLTSDLPELQNFILPGGSHPGALLHLARTVSRRTERCIVSLASEEHVDPNILQYFNRLSDLFFTMARSVNMQAKEPETIWKKEK